MLYKNVIPRGARDYEPVAIVGMACRYPGAESPSEFWRILEIGTYPIRETPASRWRADEYYDPAPGTPGKMYVRSFGFIDGIDEFDSYLFGISPRDAARMDPQHRLMLELSWEALEHAGISPLALAGSKTGVFAGVSGSDYTHRLIASEGFAELIDNRTGTGNSCSLAANRVSYALDLRGPSLAVDTACSSALVATHLACEALARRECELAIAGGVNVILSPLAAISFCQGRLLAPDGRCKAFDRTADGYVRSEGCGVVVLKRLTDALRNRDRIWGVIRGSAVNHNGRTCGIMAPSVEAQASVIGGAQRRAGVSSRSVGYVEAHGAGTPVGDLLELRSLSAVMGPPRGPEDVCWVGSVKSNIGHLEAASGMAGMMKVLLCFEHDSIPAQLHLSEVTPWLETAVTRVRIAEHAVAWPHSRLSPRIAGVSGFGFGGANAHIVIEEPPKRAPVRNVDRRGAHLLKVSAKTGESFAGCLRRWVKFLRNGTDRDLPDVCHTANTGRGDFPYRIAVVAATAPELADKLAEFGGTTAAFSPVPAKPPRIGFLFARLDWDCEAVVQLRCASRIFGAALDGNREPPGGFARCVADWWRAAGIMPDLVCEAGSGGQAHFAIPRSFSEHVDVAVVMGCADAPKNWRKGWIGNLTPGCDAWRTLLKAVAALYTAGCNINWHAIDGETGRRKTPVPTYAFAKERHAFPFS